MTLAKQQSNTDVSLLENFLIKGDISKLSVSERLLYYTKVCESLGLNPLTRPFDYITLQGKMTLYARKDATEQLRKIQGISITKVEATTLNSEVYVVTAYAKRKDGQEDVATGAVSILGLKGEAFANAIMKAETKAKRRVTLSIGGLGFLDESEIEDMQFDSPVNHIPSVNTVNIESKPEPLTGLWKKEILADIQHCGSLPELEAVFKKHQKMAKEEPEFLKIVIAEKDKKKNELIEDERQKFVDDMGDGSNDN